MKLKWLFLVVLAAFLAVPAHAQETAIPLSDYIDLLAELQSVLDANPPPAAEDLLHFADTLRGIDTVALPGGRLVPVNHEYFAGLLRSDPPAITRLQEILNAFEQISHQTAPLPASHQTALTEILSRDEFQWQEETPNPLYELWQRFMDFVLRWLDRIFPALDGASRLVNSAVFVVLGVLLIFVFRNIYLATRRSLLREADIRDGHGDLQKLTAQQAADQAKELARQGDRRSAVRFLYLSALIGLEEHGFLRADRTRTNHEFLAELSGRPDVLASLEEVTTTFDRVWYGMHPIDSQALELYEVQARALKKLRETKE